MLIALLLIAGALAVLGAVSLYVPPPWAGRAGAALLLAGLGVAVAALFTGPAELGPLRLDGLAAWTAAAILIASSPAILAAATWSLLAASAALLTVLVASPLFAAGLLVTAAITGWQRGRVPALALGAGCFYAVARLGYSGVLPIGWGLLALGAGLGAAIAGGVAAAGARRLGDAAPAIAALVTGLAIAGLGVSIAARGADLLPAATLGLEAALLFLLTGAVSLAALELAGLAIRAAAGTGEIAQVGRMWPAMPATCLSALIAAASVAALPPSSGFASFYLLLQALFAANRIGGVFVQFAFACAAAAVCMAAGLAALAMLRLLGLTLFGPRLAGSPARDPAGDARLLMAVLAALAVALGLAPGAALLLANPVLSEAGLPAPAPLLLPTFAAGLLTAAFAAVWGVMRQAPQARRGPVWDGGRPGSAELAPYVPGLLALRWRPTPRWPTLRECLAGAVLTLAVVLIVMVAR